MKKIFTIFALVCAFGILNAQTIPNPGFEQWTSDNEATGWASTFSYQGQMITFDYVGGSKSTNSHSGFAMGMKPYVPDLTGGMIPGGMIPGLDGLVLPGLVHLGTFSTDFDLMSLAGGLMGSGGIDANALMEAMVQGGIPCNRVPQSVKAWIRYVPANGDAMTVTVRCYSNGQVVAEGTYSQTSTSNAYEQITIPVTASGSTTPDQMNIIFNCGSQSGTELYVDDVELVMDGGSGGEGGEGGEGGGGTDGVSEATNVVFSVSPNPTSDVLTINPTVGGNYNAVLFDMSGKAVWEGRQLQDATQVDVSALSEGVYFLKVTANGLTRTQKVVVR